MPPHERQQPWDGVGLPPAARDRLARAAESHVATSLLSVPDAAALAAVGFSPVGEVMGCIVQQLGWKGGGCGFTFGRNESARTITSGSNNRWSGLAPYVQALYRGWETALRRLIEEARALGADGVVGIRLSEQPLGSENVEFVALGTAVRGTGTRATTPFTTDLSGADVSKLLHAGWVPTGLAMGIAVAIRHDDYRTQQQRRRWQPNTEVDGYTDLVNTVRHDARDQFERRARAHGGEAVLVSTMSLKVWDQEVSDKDNDHIAQAMFAGTAATSFRRTPGAPARNLTILPLNRPQETRR